jgi:hypothetical protein
MGTDNVTGLERNKRTIFDEIVMNYDKIREGYPGKLYEDVIRYPEPGKGLRHGGYHKVDYVIQLYMGKKNRRLLII